MASIVVASRVIWELRMGKWELEIGNWEVGINISLTQSSNNCSQPAPGRAGNKVAGLIAVSLNQVSIASYGYQVCARPR